MYEYKNKFNYRKLISAKNMILRYIGLGLLILGGSKVKLSKNDLKFKNLLATKLAITAYRKMKKREFFNTAATSSRKFYMGGFDNPMTRREAQLILNIREGVDAAKIKDSHRRLMLLNHPDSGNTIVIKGCA